MEEMRSDRGCQHWHEAGIHELIDHIVRRYHEPLRDQLPRLVELARTVEEEAADEPTSPRGLALRLAHLQHDVEQHLLREEQELFPLLREGATFLAPVPVRTLIEDHDEHEEDLRRIRTLTKNFRCPPRASARWRLLYETLASLEHELHDHFRLETEVLFPMAMRRRPAAPP